MNFAESLPLLFKQTQEVERSFLWQNRIQALLGFTKSRVIEPQRPSHSLCNGIHKKVLWKTREWDRFTNPLWWIRQLHDVYKWITEIEVVLIKPCGKTFSKERLIAWWNYHNFLRRNSTAINILRMARDARYCCVLRCNWEFGNKEHTFLGAIHC